MISDRHAKFILDEYAAVGLQPVRRGDGELVTLALARKLGMPLERVGTPTEQAAE